MFLFLPQCPEVQLSCPHQFFELDVFLRGTLENSMQVQCPRFARDSLPKIKLDVLHESTRRDDPRFSRKRNRSRQQVQRAGEWRLAEEVGVRLADGFK